MILANGFLRFSSLVGIAFAVLTLQDAFAATAVKPTHKVPVRHSTTPSKVTVANNDAWAQKIRNAMTTAHSAYQQKQYAEAEKITRSLLPDLSNPRFTVQGRASVYQILGLSIMEREGDPARLVEARRYVALSNDTIKTLTDPQLDMMRINNRFNIASMDALMGHQELALAEYQALLKDPLAADERFKPYMAYAKQVVEALSSSDQGDNYLAQFPKPYIHWQNLGTRPLRVYIEDGSALKDWHPEYPALVRKAYEEWRTQLPGAFKFEFVDQRELADTLVSWTPDPILEADGVTQELGRCEMSYFGTTLHTDNIVLALHGTTHDPVTAKALVSVALHEIGHSLGLMKSHSNNPSDIMYKSTLLSKGSSGHLTQRDIATMRMLYSQSAGFTNPEIPLMAFRQYVQFTRMAGDAVSAHESDKAVQFANQALAIYDQEPQAHYVLGVALYNQKSFQMALPEILRVVDMTGTQRPHAYLLASSSLISMANDDLRTGQYDGSMQHLQMAQEFMNSHRDIVLSPEQVIEQRKLDDAILQSMQYAQQAKATEQRGGVVVLGNSNDAPVAADSNGSKKKKGWWGRFLEASASSSVNMPVRISAPSGSF
jgi:predicted Zn-dependent protease